jgi:hypothetical protein
MTTSTTCLINSSKSEIGVWWFTSIIIDICLEAKIWRIRVRTSSVYIEFINQKNPLTGDYSCPPNYESVLLETARRHGSETRTKCHTHWWHKKCSDYTVYGLAQYNAYWCVARGKVPEQSGFLFGGLFTTTVSNPLTQAKTCPLNFYPLGIGNDIKICVSDDYELNICQFCPSAVNEYDTESANPSDGNGMNGG